MALTLADDLAHRRVSLDTVVYAYSRTTHDGLRVALSVTEAFKALGVS